MSVTDINTKVADAIAAQEGGDVAGAITKLRSAAMLLAAMPDTNQGADGLRWDRTAIQKMIEQLERLSAATRGVQRTKISWHHATEN